MKEEIKKNNEHNSSYEQIQWDNDNVEENSPAEQPWNYHRKAKEIAFAYSDIVSPIEESEGTPSSSNPDITEESELRYRSSFDLNKNSNISEASNQAFEDFLIQYDRLENACEYLSGRFACDKHRKINSFSDKQGLSIEDKVELNSLKKTTGNDLDFLAETMDSLCNYNSYVKSASDCILKEANYYASCIEQNEEIAAGIEGKMKQSTNSNDAIKSIKEENSFYEKRLTNSENMAKELNDKSILSTEYISFLSRSRAKLGIAYETLLSMEDSFE